LRRQARKDTQPELELRREPHHRDLRYSTERQVLPHTRRRVDIVFPKQRIAVFVGGCFWHSCPEHAIVPKSNREWWKPELPANVARDRDTDRRLSEAGWLVIRL
jgi:DNA mismatch endonuclease, patch repair protein